MLDNQHIGLIIPALNEAENLPSLLSAIPDYVDDIIVVDNGSTDNTGSVASNYGATVICEPRRGYGRACLAGIAALERSDIIVFLDADFCDNPNHIQSLCQPITTHEQDFVLSSRMHAQAKKYLTIPQRFGNQFACLLMKIFWHTDYQDLGPFRAISAGALKQLNMQDQDFGWTVEMQIKAAQHQLNSTELQLPYRHRQYGTSKVSGTIKGVWNAGTTILWVIARSYLQQLTKPAVASSEYD